MNVHSDFCALNDASRKFIITARDLPSNTFPQTGLTLTGSDILVSKNGAAYANFGGSVLEVGNGDYAVTLSAGEVNTAGPVIILLNRSTCAPYRCVVRVGGGTDPSSIFNVVVENGKTFAELLRLMSRTLFAKSSGGGGSTIRFRDLADTKDSVVATVDGQGNRTAITTLDGT